MNARLHLSLLIVAGCSVSPDIGGESGTTRATDPSSYPGDSALSSGEGDPGIPSTTDPTPTGGGHTGGMSDEGEAGGNSDSQSGSGQAQTSGVGGTSDTGDETTTGDTSSTGEPGTSTTDECIGAAGPDPVVLGAADDLAAAGAYALLAKAGITNIPGTSIAGGHVGVSPIAAGSLTGFALVLDPSGVFATSPAVVAPYKVFAADYVVPTPSHLTTAILDMQAAYTDAAGRVPTDYLDLNSGDIGGLTLGPGIYTWASTVLIPDDVILTGCDDDVWIFQITNDLDVSTGKSVLLAGGAQAQNVFWQIAGQATIHVGAHVEGVILSKTGITFQTDATLHGRALAQTMIALDQNAITAP
jgi:hypothetical protein